MEQTKTLIESLLEEMSRVRDLINEYESLPNGVGRLGAALMTVNIKMAEKAIANNDIIEILVQYEKLKSCQ